VPPAPTPVAQQQAAAQPVELFASSDKNTSAAAETGSAISGIAHGFSTIFGAIFSWIIFPVAVVLILHNFVFQAYHVIGTSMVPNLRDADYLIISKVGNTQAMIERTFGQDRKYIPPRGQIVVFKFPKDTSRVFVKRVIGIPGDRVVVKNGVVTVYNADHKDGFNPDANYETKETTTLIDTDEVVQPGNVFVMGDNRSPNGSYDSREWGELPSSYIIGNAVLRLLPLDQAKVL
jgi:signal peptidase I